MLVLFGLENRAGQIARSGLHTWHVGGLGSILSTQSWSSPSNTDGYSPQTQKKSGLRGKQVRGVSIRERTIFWGSAGEQDSVTAAEEVKHLLG